MTIETTLQTKIDNADSNTSTSELLRLLYSAKEYSVNSIYDSAGVMPATDSADIGRIAFAENNDGMYVFVGLDSGWRLIDSDVAGGGAAAISTALGEVSGYSLGGTAGPGIVNEIQKFSFTSDGDATDVGDLTSATTATSTSASSTHGYAAGGQTPATPNRVNVIQKTTFATDANATDVGDITVARGYGAGNTYSATHGYANGGNSPIVPYGNGSNIIDKYAFSTDGNATDVGDLIYPVYRIYGSTGPDHGYLAGGYQHPANYYNTIQRYPFASDGNATDIGDTSAPRGSQTAGSGQSLTDGYFFGGYDDPYNVSQLTKIERYPFAATANSTDVGDLDTAIISTTGHSSTTHNYSSGGSAPQIPDSYSTVIQKFPTSSTITTTDVGNLATAGGIQMNGGTQY